MVMVKDLNGHSDRCFLSVKDFPFNIILILRYRLVEWQYLSQYFGVGDAWNAFRNTFEFRNGKVKVIEPTLRSGHKKTKQFVWFGGDVLISSSTSINDPLPINLIVPILFSLAKSQTWRSSHASPVTFVDADANQTNERSLHVERRTSIVFYTFFDRKFVAKTARDKKKIVRFGIPFGVVTQKYADKLTIKQVNYLR